MRPIAAPSRRQFLALAAVAPIAAAVPAAAILPSSGPAFAAGELAPALHWFRLLAEGDDWRVTMGGSFPDLDAALARFEATLPGRYRWLSWASNEAGGRFVSRPAEPPQMPRAIPAGVHHHG